jgi:hypothetical protein
MKRPQRFTRHPLRDYDTVLGAYTVNVKPNDLVVSEGTRGIYSQVLEVDTIDRQYGWVDEGRPFKVLCLTLRPLFRGSDEHGLVALTNKTYKSTTGWQAIVRPISQAIVDEINHILPYNLQLDLSGKLSERA